MTQTIEKPDWRQSELGQIAARIVEIAPDLARIEKIEDVGLEHIALLAYALDVLVEFSRGSAETKVKPCDAAPLDAALAPVRALVAEAMPVLNANLAAAHQEYMDGAIAKGAFDYVLGRYATAARILSTDDLSFEDALQACARLTMDVRSGCSDAARPDLLNRWVDFLREAGFTDDHPLFGWPMRPGLHGNS